MYLNVVIFKDLKKKKNLCKYKQKALFPSKWPMFQFLWIVPGLNK